MKGFVARAGRWKSNIVCSHPLSHFQGMKSIKGTFPWSVDLYNPTPGFFFCLIHKSTTKHPQTKSAREMDADMVEIPSGLLFFACESSCTASTLKHSNHPSPGRRNSTVHVRIRFLEKKGHAVWRRIVSLSMFRLSWAMRSLFFCRWITIQIEGFRAFIFPSVNDLYEVKFTEGKIGVSQVFLNRTVHAAVSRLILHAKK